VLCRLSNQFPGEKPTPDFVVLWSGDISEAYNYGRKCSSLCPLFLYWVVQLSPSLFLGHCASIRSSIHQTSVIAFNLRFHRGHSNLNRVHSGGVPGVTLSPPRYSLPLVNKGTEWYTNNSLICKKPCFLSNGDWIYMCMCGWVCALVF
jgi:hypothetical protein